MAIQYAVSVPHKDICNGWIIIKTFKTRELAVDFANIVWGAKINRLLTQLLYGRTNVRPNKFNRG